MVRCVGRVAGWVFCATSETGRGLACKASLSNLFFAGRSGTMVRCGFLLLVLVSEFR